MSKQIVGSYGLYQALKDEGLDMPEDCHDVEIKFGPVDEAVQINYYCYANSEVLEKYSKALMRMAQERK